MDQKKCSKFTMFSFLIFAPVFDVNCVEYGKSVLWIWWGVLKHWLKGGWVQKIFWNWEDVVSNIK